MSLDLALFVARQCAGEPDFLRHLVRREPLSAKGSELGGAYSDADKVPFTRPIPARNWLQASNPSERWKWDFLYQDLPPVKGHNVQMEGASAFIPLKPVG